MRKTTVVSKNVNFGPTNPVSPNVYILAHENEFPEIIYAFFRGRQCFLNNLALNLSYYVQPNFERRLTNKVVMPKINFEQGFCIGKGDNPGS